MVSSSRVRLAVGVAASVLLVCVPAFAQLIDRTQAPNAVNAGIAKSFADQVGAGRGSVTTPGSSLFIINRDPFRAIRRGRQIFQRKFTMEQGLGPRTGDGLGDINVDLSIGAGLSDSCSGCHGRPRGSAGFGGDVATRPDSRDAPHLFGLGLKEMLADEMTTDLRAIRSSAASQAAQTNQDVTKALSSKGISFGTITVHPDQTVVTTGIEGVDADLRVRPFFAHGGTISIREFLVGAFNAEMGLEAADPDLAAAAGGARVVTPSGMVLDGSTDQIEAPPVQNETDDADDDGVSDEIPTSIVDYMEFYLLNYFKPGQGEVTNDVRTGQSQFTRLGCASCHVPDLQIAHDRRVADLETVFDASRSNPFNRLFATATPLFQSNSDVPGLPPLKPAARGAFTVRNILTDFKRHDLGPNFYERNYDGTTRTQFLTMPLWGVATTPPYGHDGRSATLMDVILRHGGEAQSARNAFANAGNGVQRQVLTFLESLVLFPPDDTASTLEPAAPATSGYPQNGHGSIKVTVLFNNPADPE